MKMETRARRKPFAERLRTALNEALEHAKGERDDLHVTTVERVLDDQHPSPAVSGDLDGDWEKKLVKARK